MLRARQQQQRSASSAEIQQQLHATPHHCQGVQGSALLSKAKQKHGKRKQGGCIRCMGVFQCVKFKKFLAVH